MGQSKVWSWIEAIGNTLIGYGIALAGQLVVFPMFGIAVSLYENLIIGGIFMGISTVRSYLLRRLFNWLHSRHHPPLPL